jgi:hypothetical protein
MNSRTLFVSIRIYSYRIRLHFARSISRFESHVFGRSKTTQPNPQSETNLRFIESHAREEMNN